MEQLLIHPCYFGPISQFVAIAHADGLLFENEDNYQKQTYRNRMYIYGANGKLLLNIPIKHTGDKSQHQKYRDVRIENEFHWQNQHWKSLQAAYRASPFFEFYEDEIAPLYDKKYEFLIDFNYDCFNFTMESLQFELAHKKTNEYILNPPAHIVDKRHLANAKTGIDFEFHEYSQVFDNKYGHLQNLSILDLLFNEGPNTMQYLEQQTLYV